MMIVKEGKADILALPSSFVAHDYQAFARPLI